MTPTLTATPFSTYPCQCPYTYTTQWNGSPSGP